MKNQGRGRERKRRGVKKNGKIRVLRKEKEKSEGKREKIERKATIIRIGEGKKGVKKIIREGKGKGKI